MVKIDIDNKEYNLPNDWADITMRQLLASQELLKEMPDKLRQLTFPDKKKATPKITENDEIDFWEFYRKWLIFWTDISDDVSRRIEINGLKLAYEVLQRFMGFPAKEDIKLKEAIELKGIKYILPPTETLINKKEKHMADATYEEFVEGVQLTKRLNDLKEGKLDILPILTATFYRPEISYGQWWQKKRTKIMPYDEVSTKARAELFKDLPMDEVWGAYFFLTQRLETLLSGLQNYLKEKKAVKS